MLKNYFTVALRSLSRHKGYTLLNVAGLAVGMACAVLILNYVQFERSFDRFHEDADRLYRVVQQQPGNVFLGSDRFAVTQAGLGLALREEAPDVETASTFTRRTNLIERGTERFMEPGVHADAHFFRLFSFPLERGDPARVLAEPNTVVLTASLARKLFGDADPIGRTVRFDDREDFTVTGVAADPPAASHLTFAFVRSLLSDPFFQNNVDAWDSNSWYTYLALEPGAAPEALESRLARLLRTHRPDEDQLPRLYLEPITDIHLHSRINFDVGENNDVRLLYLFGTIAVVILLLACANYTNLAVARSTRRAREVGMRKALGAGRGQLAAQHLGEAVVTALLALGLGLLLAHLALPVFSGWLERDLVLGEPGGWRFYAALAGLALTVGGIAGAYPAFVMAHVRPAVALKSGKAPLGRARLRALLVVGQYAAAIALVIGSLVIYQQMRFIQSQPLGFEREHVVALSLRGIDATSELPSFKADLERLPGVAGVAASTTLPTNVSSSTSVTAWEGHPEGTDDGLQVYQAYVDYDFLDVYGIPLVAGRNFSPAHPADTSGALVLNETAVRDLGWTPETALGKTIRRGDADVPVIGVVRDFHMHAMHLPIAPLMMQWSSAWLNHVSVRVEPAALPTTLAGIERAWAAYSPYPFDATFLDESFDRMYRAEQKLGQGVGYFTLVALFIACLGLFGLAAHAAEQRTKEIGVRKVLGASAASIVALLTKDFLRLVLVAFGLAVPLAWVGMDRWLSDFAYRIDLRPSLFLLAGGLALAVALLTVSAQAFRAASADPVKALRYE